MLGRLHDLIITSSYKTISAALFRAALLRCYAKYSKSKRNKMKANKIYQSMISDVIYTLAVTIAFRIAAASSAFIDPFLS